jgi:hypothetical protein
MSHETFKKLIFTGESSHPDLPPDLLMEDMEDASFDDKESSEEEETQDMEEG